MDGKIDTVREIQDIELDLLSGKVTVELLDEYSIAIRREFWDELRAEAETQYDRRLELLGPIETLDDAAFRKTLGDGWSAWLLAKKIIDNRRESEAKASEANL